MAEVYQVVVPGTEGDFGVLEGHAPFIHPATARSRFSRRPHPRRKASRLSAAFAEVNENGLSGACRKGGG